MERYMIYIPAKGVCRLIRCNGAGTLTLNEMQALVDGPIEVTESCLESTWAREPVDCIHLIVNEEGPTARPAVQWPGIRSVGGRRYLPPQW